MNRPPAPLRMPPAVAEWLALQEAPEPTPTRSPIGTALAVVLGLAFVAGGVTAGLATDTINGARLLALLAIAAGGALIVRVVAVTDDDPEHECPCCGRSAEGYDPDLVCARCERVETEWARM